jgi:hypothetical protein
MFQDEPSTAVYGQVFGIASRRLPFEVQLKLSSVDQWNGRAKGI